MTIIQDIDNATSLDEAMGISGADLNPHEVRKDYIAAKRDRRAVGGNFKATRANVNAKFQQVWSEEHGK